MINCIHEGKKIPLVIKYLGVKNEVNACSECVEIIKKSTTCEVLS